MSLEAGPIGPFRFASPDAGQSPRIDGLHIPPENPYDRILRMNEQELFDYLRKDITRAEYELYGETDVEAKLAFAGGSLEDDISQLTTFEGNTIYANPPKYAKDSEAIEFISMAGRVLNEGGDVVDLVSEASDLFYNFTYLAENDKDKGHRERGHKHAPDYVYLMSQIAGSLGWEPIHALRAATMKYHRRFIDKKEKDPKGEKAMMSELMYGTQLKSSSIPVPNLDQVNTARRIVSGITKNTLHHRYLEIREQKRLAASGQIYPSWSIKA